MIDDTLEVTVQSTQLKNVLLSRQSLHSGKAEISDLIPVSAERKLALPMHDAARGLHLLSLLDDKRKLLDQQPFFAHYNKRHKLELRTEKDFFHTREKIAVTINLKNLQGKPTKAICTISCVNIDRIEANNRLSFSDYYYGYALQQSYSQKKLKPMVNAGLTNHFTIKNLHKAFIEAGLVYATDYEGAEIKKSTILFIRRDSITNVATTDSNGRYYPKPRDLVVREG
ncbi:hypothetical protein ABDK00_009360 [Niabella insulamsoli]|uniref:hypothetical protein n=1 Tax=Niabella insulamsoli TaxID=3144874 RepID=UPI0031FE2B66